MTPGDRVAQLYPQALGTHFSRLLRHARVTVGLFFNPGHHTGSLTGYRIEYRTRYVTANETILVMSANETARKLNVFVCTMFLLVLFTLSSYLSPLAFTGQRRGMLAKKEADAHFVQNVH
jgi:hypothetical protein